MGNESFVIISSHTSISAIDQMIDEIADLGPERVFVLIDLTWKVAERKLLQIFKKKLNLKNQNLRFSFETSLTLTIFKVYILNFLPSEILNIKS